MFLVVGRLFKFVGRMWLVVGWKLWVVGRLLGAGKRSKLKAEGSKEEQDLGYKRQQTFGLSSGHPRITSQEHEDRYSKISFTQIRFVPYAVSVFIHLSFSIHVSEEQSKFNRGVHPCPKKLCVSVTSSVAGERNKNEHPTEKGRRQKSE